uniref:Uncharacterized protein n=1 Tax=Babesia bovis TaxID=5865 RepID=S6C8T3_BABBO|nr:hypothetical protein [Babesia bovis]
MLYMEPNNCHLCFYILGGLSFVWLIVYSYFAVSNYFDKGGEQNGTSCYKKFMIHFLALNMLLTVAATISAYQVNTYRLRLQEIELFNVVLSGLGMGLIISAVTILSTTYSDHKGTPFHTFIAVDIAVTIPLLRCYYLGKAVLYQSYGKNYVPLSTWGDDTSSDSCEEDNQSTTRESDPSLTEQNSPGEDTPLPPDDNLHGSNAVQCSIETNLENAPLSASEDGVSNITTSLTTPTNATSDYAPPFCQEEVTYILSRTGFIILCAGLIATLTSTLVMAGTTDKNSGKNGSKNRRLTHVLFVLTASLTINTLFFIRLTNPLQGIYSIDKIFFSVLGSLIIVTIVGGAIVLCIIANKNKESQWDILLPLAFYLIMILLTLFYYLDY